MRELVGICIVSEFARLYDAGTIHIFYLSIFDCHILITVSKLITVSIYFK